MSALRAPIAVAVEIRSAGGPEGPGRVFRLAAAVGEDGVRLERPAPFEIGRPVDVRLTLPDDPEPLALRAEIALGEDDGEGEAGGRELTFLDARAETRVQIHRYVADRLRLPSLP
jgi:hypothetical protein